MFNNRRQGRIRSIMMYLPRVIKFYSLKNEQLTPLVFIIILAVGFVSNIIPMSYLNEITLPTYPLKPQDLQELLETLLIVNAINLGTFMIINLFSSAYLYAYIRDLRGVEYTFGECWSMLGKKVFRIIILSILNVLAICTGLFIFIIPGIILYLMFIFSNCYLLDKDKKIGQALRASVDATNGYKRQIFSIIVTFNLLIIIVPMLIGYSGSPLIYAFVSAFLSSIINLMYQRLIALMYVDIEYPSQAYEEVEGNLKL